MRSGWTFIEIIVLLVFLSVIFSIIFPISKKWMDKTIVYAEIKNVSENVRWAKVFSYILKDKVEIDISQKIKISSKRGIDEKDGPKFIELIGSTHFAFSKGIPYNSGTMKIYFKGTKIGTLTVLPVTGLINVELGW